MEGSQQIVLALIILGLRCASAATWKASSTNCSSIQPPPEYGKAATDTTTLLALSTSGTGLFDVKSNVTSLCPGMGYRVRLSFPEARLYIMALSQGTFASMDTDPACNNRIVGNSSRGYANSIFYISVPCDAAGTLSFKVANVAANATINGSSTFQKLKVSRPIAPLQACPNSAKTCAASKVFNMSDLDAALQAIQAKANASQTAAVSKMLNLSSAVGELQKSLVRFGSLVSTHTQAASPGLPPASQLAAAVQQIASSLKKSSSKTSSTAAVSSSSSSSLPADVRKLVRPA